MLMGVLAIAGPTGLHIHAASLNEIRGDEMCGIGLDISSGDRMDHVGIVIIVIRGKVLCTILAQLTKFIIIRSELVGMAGVLLIIPIVTDDVVQAFRIPLMW